jgi:hypothetical protein
MVNHEKSTNRFQHYHQCVHCGSAFRREEFSGTAIVFGIYHCTKCGLDGPLNVAIREAGDSVESKDNSSKYGSSN